MTDKKTEDRIDALVGLLALEVFFVIGYIIGLSI